MVGAQRSLTTQNSPCTPDAHWGPPASSQPAAVLSPKRGGGLSSCHPRVWQGPSPEGLCRKRAARLGILLSPWTSDTASPVSHIQAILLSDIFENPPLLQLYDALPALWARDHKAKSLQSPYLHAS